VSPNPTPDDAALRRAAEIAAIKRRAMDDLRTTRMASLDEWRGPNRAALLAQRRGAEGTLRDIAISERDPRAEMTEEQRRALMVRRAGLATRAFEDFGTPIAFNDLRRSSVLPAFNAGVARSNETLAARQNVSNAAIDQIIAQRARERFEREQEQKVRDAAVEAQVRGLEQTNETDPLVGLEQQVREQELRRQLEGDPFEDQRRELEMELMRSQINAASGDTIEQKVRRRALEAQLQNTEREQSRLTPAGEDRKSLYDTAQAGLSATVNEIRSAPPTLSIDAVTGPSAGRWRAALEGFESYLADFERNRDVNPELSRAHAREILNSLPAYIRESRAQATFGIGGPETRVALSTIRDRINSIAPRLRAIINGG